eukprot:TRINITY_DN61202_c0_g1_i1.p1 TRINITY_DN61202_c0_g1~~TRINITY_DN61202_c0_g1_i1.p1  ORF type:complete len:541 (-),score=11.31 TRINITY_DN61202_c0_g1_i1:450-2072(-)
MQTKQTKEQQEKEARLMENMQKQQSDWWFTATDPCTLGIWRFCYGSLMCLSFMQKFLVQIAAPSITTLDYTDFHYKFPYFEWVPVPQGMILRIYAWTMILSSMFFALGWWYRKSAIVMAIGYAWFMFFDACYWNNHYYLCTVVNFMFVFVDAHHFGRVSIGKLLSSRYYEGLDRDEFKKLGSEKYFEKKGFENQLTPHVRCIPYWHLWIFQFLFFICYLYGGIAKLDRDWIRGHPPSMWMTNLGMTGIVHTLATCTITYGGTVLDLVAPFTLTWSSRTRFWTLPPVIGFHCFNYAMFSIGLFPVIMVAALVLTFDPWAVREHFWDLILPFRFFRDQCGSLMAPFLDQWKWRELKGKEKTPLIWRVRMYSPWTRRMIKFIIYLFVVYNILMPLRHRVYEVMDGQATSWNEHAHRWSWRMMLRHKHCEGDFTVVNTKTNATFKIGKDPVTGDINDPIRLVERQIDHRFKDPVFTRQYAYWLRDYFEQHWDDGAKVSVYANASCRLNGGGFQPYIDTTIDIAALERPPMWKPEPFVLPQTKFV